MAIDLTVLVAFVAQLSTDQLRERRLLHSGSLFQASHKVLVREPHSIHFWRKLTASGAHKRAVTCKAQRFPLPDSTDHTMPRARARSARLCLKIIFGLDFVNSVSWDLISHAARGLRFDSLRRNSGAERCQNQENRRYFPDYLSPFSGQSGDETNTKGGEQCWNLYFVLFGIET